MEGLVFDEPIIVSRLEYMVANPRLGRGWIVKSGDAIAGYMAVTFAFSLEHGRHAIMDEFYLHEAYRGQGLGRNVFRFVESQMLKVGVSSIHVDVERANGRAQQSGCRWASASMTASPCSSSLIVPRRARISRRAHHETT